MPVELLLLIVFILLPLIQQLLRAAQAREQRQPQQPAGPAPRTRRPAMPGPTPPSQVVLPPASAVPPAVPAMSPAPSMTVPLRAPSRSMLDAAIPASTDRRRLRHRGTMGHFLGPGTLRDAIVLMTILGPCRALAGDDAGESARSKTGFS